MDQARAWYRALWRLGVTVDLVPPHADLSDYDLVVVPTLYLVTDADAANLAAAAERGATVLITYFSGIVNEHDHVRLGGYPGAFRDLLGVRTEEFVTLQEGETVSVGGDVLGTVTADLWTEKTHVADGTEVVATYDDGAMRGRPAITRRPTGEGGAAWYVATRLDPAGVEAVARAVVAEAGVEAQVEAPSGVEVVRRWSGDGATSWLFAINHTDREATLQASGSELLTGADVAGELVVPAGGVRVLRTAP
jgi:beta-galactosidase